MLMSVIPRRSFNLSACLRRPTIKFRYGAREQHQKLEIQQDASLPRPTPYAHSVQTIEVVDEFELPLRFKRKPLEDAEIQYINRGGPE